MNYEDKFEKMENPYAAWAGMGTVGDPTMFFGHTDLIQRIAHTIRESREQSKCVLIYGQYRSGKSTILYHLGQLLQEDRKLFVLDLRNIVVHFLGPYNSVPYFYQFPYSILRELERAIEERIHEQLRG